MADCPNCARLESWVGDLQAGMWINCVYCGHRYGPDDEHAATLVDDGATPSMQDALKAHVEQCPEHPMSALRTECARLEESRDLFDRTATELSAECRRLREALAKTRPDAERAAERMASAIHRLVYRRVIGSRSEAADAALDWRMPTAEDHTLAALAETPPSGGEEKPNE